MNTTLAILIFGAQGAAMGFDELVFHRERGLPRWERWGHPIDTLSVLLCLGTALVLPARQPWTGIYFGLAIFSCLCVTKDEWIHVTLCKPAEQWLHALLFLLHPVLLWTIYSLWRTGEGIIFLRIETSLCAIFMLYQILHWNLPWRKT